MTARNVGLDNLNEEENEYSDNVFSDSDYDSQSDNDFVEEDDTPNNPGISSKPLPVAISKLTVNNKNPNTNKQVKKSSETKSNQILKGKDLSKNEPAMRKKSTTTIVDVHKSDVNGNGQMYNESKSQTNKTVRYKSGQETAMTGPHSANLSRGPSANVRINDDTLGEIDEWGSPTFDAAVNQTNKASTSEVKLAIQDIKQNNTDASNNDLHDKGKSWDEDDDWGNSLNKTSESQKATTPRRFNIGLNKQKNTAINTTWDEGNDWGDSFNKTNETKLETNKKSLILERKGQHKYSTGNSEWDEDAGWGDSYPHSSDSKLPTSARMLQTQAQGQELRNANKTNQALVSMSNETHKNDNNAPSGWTSPLSTSRSDNANDNANSKKNMVKTSGTDHWDAKNTKHTNSSHVFGKQRNMLAPANNESKTNVSVTFGKQPSKTSNVNGQSIHESSSFISQEFTDNSRQANSERLVQQKVHPQIKGHTSVAQSEVRESKADKGKYDHSNLNTQPFDNKQNKNKVPSQGNNESSRNNGNDRSLSNRRTDVHQRPHKNGKIPSRDQQKSHTSTMEYKNIFYMEDEIENVKTSIDTKDLPESERPKSEQNGRMIPTKAWQPQTQKLSMKSGRKTPVKSIPKAQSWTTMEPEPVIETDRLGKKFPFLNVDQSSSATTPKMKRNASETDVHKFDSAMSELRRTSEPVKSDKMKDAVNAFTETTKKSNKSSLSYGFGVHDRFKAVAAAWLAKFRGKKNPVKTVNSEWF